MKTILAILSAASLAACVGEIGANGNGDDDGSGSGSDKQPVTCDQARTYTDMGGGDITTDRPKIEAGSDRLRLKPFAALSTEYNRALGLTGFSAAAYKTTFGAPPPRWYQEPTASASTVYASFSLGYEACTQATASGTDYAMAPDATVADRLCRQFARTAWMREATDTEAAACVDFAVNQTKPSDSTRVRWAYTCAAVLTASGFLAY